MKKILTDLLKSTILQSFFVLVGVAVFFQFIIFPGLTVANTLYNIASGITAIFILLFVMFYVKATFLDEPFDENSLFEPEPDKEPETELDYNPEGMVPKPKKTRAKSTPKIKTNKPVNKPKK